jgi:hypothetical protein
MGSPWFTFISQFLIVAFVYKRMVDRNLPWPRVILTSVIVALATVGLHLLLGKFHPAEGIAQWVKLGHF